MYIGERFNAYSHLIGVILSIVGTVFLLIKSISEANAYKIISASVYGATLILLYLCSTLFHSAANQHRKNILQKFDHCAIYLLIAGSYTPFSLVSLNGAWGWSLFGVSWGLATFGIIQELFWQQKNRYLSLFIYLIMGWLIVVAFMPIINALTLPALFFLVLGGLFYSVGVYWYVNDEKIRHGHGIWHLFVLAGSFSQFLAVYFWVI